MQRVREVLRRLEAGVHAGESGEVDS
jgi:hypothetical protein